METAFTFGGLPADYLKGRRPRFSVLPVPYDLTASYVSGTRLGPRAIIEASTHMELYDEELGCEPYRAGIETLPPIEPTALGPGEMIDKVKRTAAGIIRSGKVPVLLGGEHSVTLGVVQALLKKYPLLSVLQLDAHADMRDTYMDSPFNHACVARRISELCPIVQVGIRSLSVEEARFLKKAGGAGGGKGGRGDKGSKGSGRDARISTYYAAGLLGDGAEALRDQAISELTGDVFITVDLDVFDPAIMPSTGTPEPGGLLWYDTVRFLKKAVAQSNVVGFDVVELCPTPGLVAPDFLTARLVYKMIGYIGSKKSR
jgi:agmatinase